MSHTATLSHKQQLANQRSPRYKVARQNCRCDISLKPRPHQRHCRWCERGFRRCHTCNVIARLSCRMQLRMSHIATLSHKPKIDQSAFVAFSRQSCIEQSTALLSCATVTKLRDTPCHTILSRDKVARQSCATKFIAGVTSVLELQTGGKMWQ